MRFAALAVVAIILAGCNKHRSEITDQNQNSSNLGTPVTNGPDGKLVQALPPPPPKISANADNYVRQNVNGTVDANLTALLRDFIQKNGRLPQSFTEFANRGLDSTPRPPEGTKWVIDGPNQQVKAVSVK